MFQTGDTVIYGVHGVCDVTDLEEKVIDRKKVTYLVLEPQGQTGARFLIPTHNAAAMAKLQRILSREELEALMGSEAVRQDCWIADENQRKQAYRELISSGDRLRLMGMVHSLYRHRARQTAQGKKIHLCDDNFLRDAEKLLISEVMVVMKMEPDAAKAYVRSRLQ